MATVRYKMMPEAKRVESPKGEIIHKNFNPSSLPDRIKILNFEKAKDQISIVDADIVVSGGKGLGGSEGFGLIKRLAKTLGGAVGASRPTVDEGWINYRHQVGLSGRTVRPKIYMACGISGSVQHQAGMKTSDIIIALNKDSEAPIFKISTLGAVGDLYEIIPRLIKKIKENSEID
jgi:electron transfer flavoprotein alpha subunit